MKKKKKGKNLIFIINMTLGSVIVLFPLIWMVLTSLKTQTEMFSYPPTFIPKNPQWNNYLKVMEAMPFSRFLLNSTMVSVLPAIGQIITCSLAAYVFAWKRFPGKDIFFSLIVATLMVPYQVTIIPTYILMRHLGWIDTLLPIIVPGFLGGAFGIFLLRQYFMTIPSELLDAARIDGCNDYAIYRKIILPLAKPALATLGVFTFMLHWNDLLRPVIYLASYQKMTLTVGLAFFKGQYSTDWSLLMSGAVISMLPILILYLFAQKYFEQGMVMSGMKG